jgi:hypothetical protein
MGTIYKSATDTNIVDKAFHGFKLNKQGDLNIEVITDDTDIVKLPDDTIIDDNDYKHWFWTDDTITYQWDTTTRQGHLLMKIL